MTRYTCISSVPGVMRQAEYEPKSKVYDKSIVDRSCFTTLDDQLAKCQPMTQSEIEQHYDFIDGRDDGRKMPMPKGVDISEITVATRKANEKLKTELQRASDKLKEEQAQKEHIQQVLNSSNT